MSSSNAAARRCSAKTTLEDCPWLFFPIPSQTVTLLALLAQDTSWLVYAAYYAVSGPACGGVLPSKLRHASGDHNIAVDHESAGLGDQLDSVFAFLEGSSHVVVCGRVPVTHLGR